MGAAKKNVKRLTKELCSGVVRCEKIIFKKDKLEIISSDAISKENVLFNTNFMIEMFIFTHKTFPIILAGAISYKNNHDASYNFVGGCDSNYLHKLTLLQENDDLK